MVRYDALAAHSRRHRAESCGTILIALQDRSPQVRLEAIDLLGGGCAPDATVTDTLARLADALPRSKADRGWHEPAHALVALAKIAPEEVRPRMARFAAHPQWQVRAYAARAAAAVGDAALLEKLARDISDNVRTAAISGLIPVRQHAADPIYLEALTARDYQLIITAARGLAGTPGRAGAVSALFASLAQLTRERRDTARDPRIAIIQRLREVGSSANVAALTPYLADSDPRVATLAAEVLTGWTGMQHKAISKGLDPGSPPQIMDIENLGSATARVTMRIGGSFEFRLLPEVAPATVLRFVHLARAGYFDGLTFHRVEPNFVIQGGSPGANEYMGDARFMRDELGRLMHARGTVGISTRGRDTGDAQIFVNLVDNPRLDPDYTVFAETIQGLEVIDGVLEGDTIDHIEIRAAPSAARRK
jgi:cyclophilin family peptidyl-prolyl cis-trans isomerase